MRPTAWSLADQGVYSGSNFVLGFVCVRLLPVQDYGIFSVAFSLSLFFAGFYNSLLLEPMCVKAPAQSVISGPHYLRVMEYQHLLGSFALLLLTLPLILPAAHLRAGLAEALACSLWFTPAMLYQWLMRRACYVWGTARLAAASSLLYAAALGAVFAALYSLGVRGYAAPLAAMAAASLAGGLYVRRILIPAPPSSGSLRGDSRLIWRGHWAYSRWVLPAALLYWVAEAAFPAFLLLGQGSPASALYRAADTLFLPLSQAIAAFCLFYLPRLARGGAPRPERVRRFSAVSASVVALSGLVYLGLAILLAPWLVRVLFANPFYDAVIPLIPWLGLAAIQRAVCDLSLSTPLRACGQPRLVFFPVLAGAVVTAAGCAALIPRMGAGGAVAVRAVSATAQAIVLLLLYRSYLRGDWGLAAAGRPAASSTS
jgi:O-antigen/teichoic acid export membrane protein